MKRRTLGLGLSLMLTLASACGDDDGGGGVDAGGTEDESDETEVTDTDAEETTETEDTEHTEETEHEHTEDTDIPDGHEIPDSGAVSCAELAAVCHGSDMGGGDLGDECHDIGHLGDEEVCAERYDECMAFCIGGDAGAHEHDEPIELGEDDTIPGVALMAERDAMAGWNLHVELSDFTLAPESASTEHVDGEGHMHLYIDGEKLTRVYGEWFYLGDLEPGEHELRMELSANSHAPFSYDGALIDDTMVIEQPEHGNDGPHEDGETFDVGAADAPSVELDVHVDPMSGWNLEITTDGFSLAPENASGEHAAGEGHMHLYVDGVKQTRVYSEWYYLSGLTAGEHEVAIELSTNDHRAYAVEGEPIWGTAHVIVSEEQAGEGFEHGDAGAHMHMDASAQ